MMTIDPRGPSRMEDGALAELRQAPGWMTSLPLTGLSTLGTISTRLRLHTIRQVSTIHAPNRTGTNGDLVLDSGSTLRSGNRHLKKAYLLCAMYTVLLARYCVGTILRFLVVYSVFGGPGYALLWMARASCTP